MCTWSLDMIAVSPASHLIHHRLQDPVETIDLKSPRAGKETQVPVTCMGFPVASFNNFVVGSEDSCVYTGTRHGQKAGIADCFAVQTNVNKDGRWMFILCDNHTRLQARATRR